MIRRIASPLGQSSGRVGQHAKQIWDSASTGARIVFVGSITHIAMTELGRYQQRKADLKPLDTVRIRILPLTQANTTNTLLCS